MLYTRLKGGVSMRSLTLALLLVALVAIPVLDQAQAKEKDWDDWKFGIGLYLPLTNVSGSLSMASPTGGEDNIPLDLGFRDVVEYWKGGFSGVLALKRRRWSFNLDLMWVKLESDMSIPVLISEAAVKTTLSLSEHEFFIGYQISDPDEGVSEIIFGTRYIGHNIKLKADTVTPALTSTGIDEEVSKNWWMGFIGARHIGHLLGAEKWYMVIRADVGAFDTSGRLTWRADLGANWKFAKHWNLGLMYKWLGVDYKKGQPGDSDYYYYKATEHGPVFGIGINF
jgi:hypothetical protein